MRQLACCSSITNCSWLILRFCVPKWFCLNRGLWWINGGLLYLHNNLLIAQSFYNMSLAALLIVWVSLFAGVSTFKITPLRAGSITVSNSDLRAQKILHRKVDLSLSSDYFHSRKDIKVIAAITSLSMDSNINFHFGYGVVCESAGCWLNFTLERYGEINNPNFDYYLKADYLVAHGLRVYDLNMTSFQ